MGFHCIAGSAVILAILGVTSCQHSSEPGETVKQGSDSKLGAHEVGDITGVTANVGKQVRVRGTAQNDKLSAVIEAHGVTVYCLDVEGGPPERVGKLATIEGSLERTDQFTARPSDGLASQGTSGSIFVLRHCALGP